jgi:hypothetical protein
MLTTSGNLAIMQIAVQRIHPLKATGTVEM